MARLDGRRRSAVDHADPRQPRHLRPAEDHLVASRAPNRRTVISYGRHNRWRYLGLVNEPCFKEATGPDPNRYGLWLDVRDSGLSSRSVCRRRKYPGREDRRARQDRSRRLLLRRADRLVGLRLFPNPDFDEEARRRNGTPSASTTIPATTTSPHLVRPYRVGMSCGVLSCRAEPDQAAGRSREPEVGESELERWRPVLWWDRLFTGAVSATKAAFSTRRFTVSPGDARYLARLERQHQQPEDDERRLQPAAAHARRRNGARRRSPAAT